MDTMLRELVLPEDTYQALAEAAKKEHKTAGELAVEAIESYLSRLKSIDPLLGLFADEEDLIDAVAEDAAQSRNRPLRLIEVVSG